LNGVRSSKPPLAGFLRVRLIAAAVSVLAFVGALVLGLAGILSHQAVLGTAALIAVIVGGAANAVIEVWRAHFLWRSGAWASMNGERRTRDQQPARFAIYLTLHTLFAAIWGGVCGFLAWTLFQP
jgi:hypothetical protein